MTLESNEHTHTHKDKNYKLKCLKLTIYDCSSKSFKLQSKFYSARVIFPCSYAVYMYKIMICKLLLNTFSSEISWQISTKFHVDPTVEMGLRVCSNGHTPLTVMPIYGKIMIIKKKTTFFFKTKNCSNDDPFISCSDSIGKMLHNICISAVAFSLR